MKTVFINQGPPHDAHKAWAEQITNIFIPYIPKLFCRINFLNDFIYRNSILNQLLALLNVINIPNADIYLVEGFKTILPAILKKKKKTKIILINSDTFFANYPKTKGLVRQIYKWYIKKVDYFICTSSIMKKAATTYSKAPAFIVYPFIDTEKFINKKADLNNNNICTISTARYSKGADIMLDAFNLFLKEFPESNLFVCDWGESIDLLKKNKNIITPGFCDPLPYLAKSSLYVNAARVEPFGINILEAMIMGIPPVISENCGAKDFVKKVDDFLICKADPEEIAKKLIILQKNKKLKAKLGNKCRKIALTNDKKNSIARFKQVFSIIVKEIQLNHKKE